jgi:hypothetical protein
MPVAMHGELLPHLNESDKFDGVNKDVYDFFNTFYAIALSYCWAEARQLQVFLTGPALQFWQTLNFLYKQSIKQAQDAFVKQYGNAKVDYLTEFFSSRPLQDQRVGDFANALHALLLKAEMPMEWQDHAI